MTLNESILKNIKQDDNHVRVKYYMENILKLEEGKDYTILKNGKIDVNTSKVVRFAGWYESDGAWMSTLPKYINFEMISASAVVFETWNYETTRSLDKYRLGWEGWPKQIYGDVMIRDCFFSIVSFAGFPKVKGYVTIEKNDYLREIKTFPCCDKLEIRNNKNLQKLPGFSGKYFNPTLAFVK